MKKIILTLALVSMCFPIGARADSLDQLDELEWAHEEERNNCIEFAIWQIIFTRHGILVVADYIYNPSIIGYDNNKELYYMSLDSPVADQRCIKNDLQLYNETKRIRNILVKKK